MEAQKKVLGNTDSPNTVLAEKLRHFVPLKKATTEEFPQSLSVVPIDVPVAQEVKSVEAVVLASNHQKHEEPRKQIPKQKKKFASRSMLAKSVQDAGVTQSVVTSNVPAPKGNVSAWFIMQRDSQKLVAHVADLIKSNEKPLLVISVKDGGKDFVVLEASLVRNESEVRFRVSSGKGRLFEAFPKNTVFFNDELSSRVSLDPSREQIVREFIVELNVLKAQQHMTLCDMVNEKFIASK